METENTFTIFTAIDLIVSIIAVIGNIGVIVILLKDKNSKTRMLYYIMSLSCADLLSGVVAIPTGVLIEQEIEMGHYSCLCMISTVLSTFSISKLSILAITIDRYRAVVHPLPYRLVRKSPPINSILFCWITGITIGSLPLLGWRDNSLDHIEDRCTFSKIKSTSYFLFQNITGTMLPMMSIFLIYGLIYVKVKKINSRQDESKNESESQTEQSSFSTTSSYQYTQKREINVTWNISIVVSLFFICWIPLNVLNLIEKIYDATDKYKCLLITFIILSHSNSAINPFLYSFQIKTFRKSLFRVLRIQKE
ncbi:adenosine receptor A2b-like [Chironomus tepperi]|uniref:adenosine receptor A2b-like n=1 Tax=Chironomus tepperi TaxID=113505 RepID=UPI00391FBA2D